MLKLLSSNPCIRIFRLAAIALCCTAVLVGCGEDDEDDANRSTGFVRVSWASSDCSQTATSGIVAIVYDGSFGYITYGGPWACASEQGLVANVTAGFNRTVVLFAEDASGAFKLRGEKRGIAVQENSETQTNAIQLYNFVPLLKLIENDAAVVGEFDLTWDYVTFADGYRIILADNAGFQAPEISEMVSSPTYTPTVLTTGVLYYWKVQSLDSFGNTSAGSEIRRFLFREPDVSITSPLDGALFSTLDDIEFSGQALDLNGAPLTGSSLVWESSLDGILASGETFSLFDLGEPPLSEGAHTVTLTATDDEGYAGSDSITMTLVAPE
jgi:hypothetical protein